MDEPLRFDRIQRLFETAIELEGSERACFLDQTCAGDPELRLELERLISCDERAGGFIQRPAIEMAASLFDQTAETVPSRQIGPYKVVRELGSGGMGRVYLAIRDDDQFKKLVAIKLIRPGLDSHPILRRFRAERQILASLDHPNIARLLDGGTTADSLPYLVMEYVEGEEIDTYCSKHRLSIRGRLELFRSVCSAVHYAHQNLVIHRDIKPQNILVDASGAPKLLDFGLAKLLDIGPDRETVTATMLQVMTPEYASPEQVRGESLTTATDVYSLGVLLYEILTGRRPYEIKSRTLRDIQRVVCERNPEKPSSAIVPAPDDSQTSNSPVPESRLGHGIAARDRHRLRGDLDNIVLMALRKEPSRRYASAEQLSEDIRRHLEGFPVIARTDTFLYRAGKFVGRNRLAAGAGLLLTLALISGAVATAWQARIAREERNRALIEQMKAERRFADVRRLVNEFLFQFHDAIADLPGSTKAREMVVTKALEYLDALAAESSADPSLQRELAAAYRKVGDVQGKPYSANIGDTAGALISYRKAGAIYENLGRQKAIAKPEMLDDLGQIYEQIGGILRRSGDLAGTIQSDRQALDMRQALAALDPSNSGYLHSLAESYIGVADDQRFMANFGQALVFYDKASRIYNQLAASRPGDAALQIDLARLDQRFAFLYQQTGDLLRLIRDSEGAMRCYREAMDRHARGIAVSEALVRQNPNNGVARRRLADSLAGSAVPLIKAGAGREAERRCARALPLFEELLAADPTNAEARYDLILLDEQLGEALQAEGKTSEALMRLRRCRAAIESIAAKDPSNKEAPGVLGSVDFAMGTCFASKGNLAEGSAALKRAFDRLDAFDNGQTTAFYFALQPLDRLTALLTASGNQQEARRIVAGAIARHKRAALRPTATSGEMAQYGWLLLICQPKDLRDPQAALDIATKAAQTNKGNDLDPLLVLAIAEYANRNNDAGIQTLRQAFSQLPEFVRPADDAEAKRFLEAAVATQ